MNFCTLEFVTQSWVHKNGHFPLYSRVLLEQRGMSRGLQELPRTEEAEA